MTLLPEDNFTVDERQALHVLAWLFLRAGFMERAERVYAGLSVLDPSDARANMGLAAVELAKKNCDPERVLDLLDKAETNGTDMKGAGLRLMKARALWLCGRGKEARAVLGDSI